MGDGAKDSCAKPSGSTSVVHRRLAWIAPAGVTLFVLLTGGSCSEGAPAVASPAEVVEADLGPPTLRLVVVTDLDGYLEPCGCTSRPLGGIDRMAAELASIRSEGAPTFVLAAGNLFFHGAPHGGDADRAAGQERMRAEALTGILDRLSLDAAAPGPLDLGYGVDTLRELADRAEFPLLAAGIAIGEPSVTVPSRLIRRDGHAVGVVGFVDALPDGDGVHADDVRAATTRAVEALRAEGAEIVVALSVTDQRTARRLGVEIPGIDFVVQGGRDEPDASPPVASGDATVLHAGRQGQGLVVVDVHRRSDGTYTDASAWTREARVSHTREEIAALETRIAAWERDPEVSAEDVATQRSRLATLERDVENELRVPAVSGNAFRARYLELPPEAARDASITTLMGALDRRVNDHNRQAFADWVPAPAADGAPHYVGSEQCNSCHAEAFAWWRGHHHGRAYETLSSRHKNFNLSCVGCHVTGYLEPGGSTVTHTGVLEDVGCESCHGPASQHVANPTAARVDVIRDPAASTCRACHNPEHSDRFNFDVYRSTLLVPGHGRPSARPAAP